MQPAAKMLKRLIRATHARREAAIVALETLYRQFRTQPRLSVTDLVQATRLHNRIVIYTPELYFVISGVLFLLLTTGAFTPHALGSEYTRIVFIGSILILSILIPLSLNFVFMPLHFIGGLSLYWTDTLMLIVATPLITLSARHITYAVAGIQVSPSFNIFAPVFGTLQFGTLLLLQRNYQRVCYHCFHQRYPDSSLETTLPPEAHGPLFAMEAQDHYVLFITANGEHLQRITLTDAINLVPKGTGLRVHRSHWVAKSEILDLVQVQQKYCVILRNGRHVPVGKAKVDAVRALL